MRKTSSDHEQGRVYGGESLAERSLRRRERFLEAGLTVFGSVGHRAATVRQLCREAELTDRYFYESFDSTEDLLMAVYRRQIERLQQAVLAALVGSTQETDPLAPVQAGLTALFELAADPRVARVCWLDVLGVSPRVDAMYTQTVEGFADLVVGFARQQQPKRWPLDAEETRMLGLALVGAVSQTVMHWHLGGHRESTATMVGATARVFRGVWATLWPAPVGATGQVSG